MRAEVYRNGRVHVCAEMCSTCIFRPGNPMYLKEGRVKGMVRDCLREETVIPCHKTIYDPAVQPAVCRGFFNAYGDKIQALQIAQRLNLVEEDELHG